jgi:putative tryptophan/tyrosine transport system substrate-binding protein
MKRRQFITLLGGTAATWPIAARAQQPALPVIGYLHFGSSGPFEFMLTPFRQGLRETGYVEGQNVAIEYRWAEGRYDRLPTLAADLVGRKVDVLVAVGPPCARAAKDATSTIPIVFSVGTDPVAEGLVTNLARPTGNLTGISILQVDLIPKRLELLCELVPHAKIIGLLINPNNPNPWIGDVEQAARVKGVQLQVVKASSESEIDAAFATLVQLHADGLIIGDDVFFTSRREQLVALASRHSVPAIERWREFAAAGGLISYGPTLSGVSHQTGIYVGRILKGAKPSDLPVVQPTKFELLINLQTAKALGLEVPPTLLARADEVIE